MDRNELRQLLRAATEEHQRTYELLDGIRGAGSPPPAARSADRVGPKPVAAAFRRWLPLPRAGRRQRELEAKLVWIFGSPRSGSTWLLRMLGGHPELATIDETYLGAHLVPVGGTVEEGEYFEHGQRAEDPSYFFARRYLPEFRPLLRELVLRGLESQVRHLKPAAVPRWVVIKEPNGSHAADTLVSLLPSSRMLYLLRDGRDVIDSLVDAMLREETWWKGPKTLLDKERAAFVSQHSTLWVHRTRASQRAFAALPEARRLLVRYEELLSDTPAQLRRIFDWLGVDPGEGGVEAIAARHAFAAVPEERRGPGKPVRAASPGLWRQNLSAEEQQVMHEIMGEKLREMGYET